MRERRRRRANGNLYPLYRGKSFYSHSKQFADAVAAPGETIETILPPLTRWERIKEWFAHTFGGSPPIGGDRLL